MELHKLQLAPVLVYCLTCSIALSFLLNHFSLNYAFKSHSHLQVHSQWFYLGIDRQRPKRIDNPCMIWPDHISFSHGFIKCLGVPRFLLFSMHVSQLAFSLCCNFHVWTNWTPGSPITIPPWHNDTIILTKSTFLKSHRLWVTKTSGQEAWNFSFFTTPCWSVPSGVPVDSAKSWKRIRSEEVLPHFQGRIIH